MISTVVDESGNQVAPEAFKAAMTSAVVKQTLRIELLDKDENTIEQIETEAIDGSVSVDGERDVVRQFNLTLENSDGLKTWNIGGKYWIDKKIKPYIGLKTQSGWHYTPLGVFFLQRPTANSQSRTASFSGGDKMVQFDGSMRGKLANAWIIPKDTLITDAIRLLAVDGGELESKIAFNQCTVRVPFELTYQPGEPRLKAMRELADLAVYQLFYDVNGFLRFRPLAADPLQQPVSWRYDESEWTLYAGGEKILDDDKLFNKVVVVGGSSQSATVYAERVNDDQNHPFSTVNIGERVYFHNGGNPDPLITKQDYADARADYELQRLMRVVERHSFYADPNFLHEAGDVCEIVDTNTATNAKFELMRFNIPLSYNGQMTLETARLRGV